VSNADQCNWKSREKSVRVKYDKIHYAKMAFYWNIGKSIFYRWERMEAIIESCWKETDKRVVH